MSVPGAQSLVVFHPWLSCLSVLFSCAHYVVGLNNCRAHAVVGFICVGDDLIGVPGASSIVVLHLWLPYSYVLCPSVHAVVVGNNRRVNAVGGIVLLVLLARACLASLRSWCFMPRGFSRLYGSLR